MENELRFIDEQNIISINEYYKYEFPNQKLEGDKLFEQFRERKLSQYGKDAKLFKCKKDSIYFYISKVNCEVRPYYYQRCPLCHNYICYFCGRNIRTIDYVIKDNGCCCLKLRLYYLFYKLGFEYFNGLEHADSLARDSFCLFLIISNIPLVNLFFFSVSALSVLYWGLLLKDKKYRFDVKGLYAKDYQTYIEVFYPFQFLRITVFTTFALYSICYYIYEFYFKILLWVASIIFKFLPMKYYIAVLFHAIA